MDPAPRQAVAEACEKRIRRSWRSLTGGRGVRDPDRKTLVACSGGVDSSALAIALASTPAPITIGHVLHDLRPREDAEADRDSVRALADRLGRSFVEGAVAVSELDGNDEANARDARYASLLDLAESCGSQWIATAHHADDVLETMLMRLLRGAGVRGLAGVAPTLALEDAGSGVCVVRPCLEVSRLELVAVCDRASWSWREDRTNTDESRLRAALRARVTPELRRLAPEGAKRAVVSSGLLRDAQALIRDRASELIGESRSSGEAVSWPRAALRGEPGVVLGELLTITCGSGGMAPETLREVICAIRDETTDPRRWVVVGRTIRVTAHEVALEKDREQ